MIQYFLLALGLLCFLILWWRFQTFFKLLLLKLKHGNKVQISFGLFGHHSRFRKAFKTHGDMLYYDKQPLDPKCEFKICNGIRNRLRFTIYTPEHLRQFINNPQFYRKMISDDMSLFLKQGLIYQEGAEWKKSRTLLGKHFEYQQLVANVPRIKQLCRDYLTGSSDVITQASLVAGGIVTQAFFGMTNSDILIFTKFHEFIEKLTTLKQKNIYSFLIIETFIPRKYRKYFYLKEYQLLLEQAEQLKQSLRALIQTKSNNQEDFVSAFIPDLREGKITEEYVIHQYITLIFAGMDTTSHLFGACCYALACHKEIQDRLRKDIQLVNKNFDDLKSEDLSKIPYLQSFIDECLRMYTPAPQMLDRLVLQDHYIGDVLIKKGQVVVPNFMIANYNSHKDPHTFNPDRWKNTQLKQYEFIPFSAGQRNCIGQHLSMLELKIMLIYILTRYEIQKLSDVKWGYRFVYSIHEQTFVKLRPLNE